MSLVTALSSNTENTELVHSHGRTINKVFGTVKPNFFFFLFANKENHPCSSAPKGQFPVT